MGDIASLQVEIFNNARDHGFWSDAEQQNIPSKIALTHSELSEALEEYRAGRMGIWIDRAAWANLDADEDETLMKPEGFPVELADAVIRILDIAGFLGIDLEEAIRRKMAYNRTREKLHGKRV